jgi:glutathione synthase
MKPLHIGFVVDEPKNIDAAKDTTLLMISECNRIRSAIPFVTTIDKIHLRDGELIADWEKSTYRTGDDWAGSLTAFGRVPVDSLVDILVMRKDPPVDESYIASTQLLRFAESKVINSPDILLTMNEKMIPLNGPYGIPETYILNDLQLLSQIMEKDSGKWVMKPLDERGGNGVFLLENGYYNKESLINMATRNGTRKVMLQRFLPDVFNGDKRIFLLNGKPLGWMNRIPPKDDFRANIHLGASAQACTLTTRDLAICEWVNSVLPPEKVPLVALDIIGDYLSEVNITSPSGIPEINQIMGKNLEKDMMETIMEMI